MERFRENYMIPSNLVPSASCIVSDIVMSKIIQEFLGTRLYFKEKYVY